MTKRASEAILILLFESRPEFETNEIELFAPSPSARGIRWWLLYKIEPVATIERNKTSLSWIEVWLSFLMTSHKHANIWSDNSSSLVILSSTEKLNLEFENIKSTKREEWKKKKKKKKEKKK